MAADAPYSRREVSRAGQLLASRLLEFRRGERPAVIEAADEEGARARLVVEWWRDQHVAPMLAVHEIVRSVAPPLTVGDSRVTAVSFRPKRFESTIEKLTREPGKLADMADIGGVRAVVDAQEDVDQLAARLDERLTFRRVRDWARNPRPTGYRAVHLHVQQAGRIIEVQLRTFGQDAWANVVEEESRLSGMNYKAGEGHEEVLAFFRLVADFFGAIELGETHADLAVRCFAAYQRARPLVRTPRLRDLQL